MWFASTPAAWAQGADSASASAQNLPIFYLISVLCLFGYLLFTNHTLNSRIENLSRSGGAREGSEGGPLAAPFSWDDIGDEGAGLPLFGERVVITRSGLYLVGARDDSLLTTLAANLIFQALSLDDISILYVSQRMARDELGRTLLSLEAGARWDELSSAERARRRKRLQGELDKYETCLYAIEEMDWTPDSLFSAWQQMKASGQTVAAMLVDDPGLARLPEARCAEVLDRLRLVSLKAGIPVFILASTARADLRFWQGPGSERFAGLLEVDGPAAKGGTLEVHFIKYPEAPPDASFELDAASGQIVVTR